MKRSSAFRYETRERVDLNALLAQFRKYGGSYFTIYRARGQCRIGIEPADIRGYSVGRFVIEIG